MCHSLSNFINWSWCLLFPCIPSSFWEPSSMYILGYTCIHRYWYTYVSQNIYTHVHAPTPTHWVSTFSYKWLTLHFQPQILSDFSSEPLGSVAANRITFIFWQRTKDFKRKWTKVPQVTAEPDLHLGHPPPGSGVHPSPTPNHSSVPSLLWVTQL